MYAFLYMDMPVYMYLYTKARGSDPEMSLLGRTVERTHGRKLLPMVRNLVRSQMRELEPSHRQETK